MALVHLGCALHETLIGGVQQALLNLRRRGQLSKRRLQPAGAYQKLGADIRGIARMQGQTLVGRSVIMGGTDRQELPHTLAGRREKLNKSIGLGTQGTACPPARQGCEMQQNARATRCQWIHHNGRLFLLPGTHCPPVLGGTAAMADRLR